MTTVVKQQDGEVEQRNPASAPLPSEQLDTKVEPLHPTLAELTSLGAEIDRLTKKYTDDGLQVSEFPASYHALTEQYRQLAMQSKTILARIGPAETKTQKEAEELKAQAEQKVAEAKVADAAAHDTAMKKATEEAAAVAKAEEEKRVAEEKKLAEEKKSTLSVLTAKEKAAEEKAKKEAEEKEKGKK